jgi:hypothetical protein
MGRLQFMRRFPHPECQGETINIHALSSINLRGGPSFSTSL